VGSSSVSGKKGGYDLDGATFVKIRHMADEGMKYIDQTKFDSQLCTEPLKFTLASVCELLALVGFTDKTSNAGRIDASEPVGVASMQSAKDAARIDEIVAFRAAVRLLAITGIRNKNGMPAAKEVLRLCDELRDDVMPSFGVEVLDGKTGSDYAGGWRNCSPRERT
jgi:hypothetical protein